MGRATGGGRRSGMLVCAAAASTLPARVVGAAPGLRLFEQPGGQRGRSPLGELPGCQHVRIHAMCSTALHRVNRHHIHRRPVASTTNRRLYERDQRCRKAPRMGPHAWRGVCRRSVLGVALAPAKGRPRDAVTKGRRRGQVPSTLPWFVLSMAAAELLYLQWLWILTCFVCKRPLR